MQCCSSTDLLALRLVRVLERLGDTKASCSRGVKMI